MTYWLTIEVDDGGMSAERWRDAHGRWLTEAAITDRARTWEWHRTRWGVALEVELTDEQPATASGLFQPYWPPSTPCPIRYRDCMSVPAGGLGADKPRKSRPAPLAGAAVASAGRELFLDTAGRPVGSREPL